MNEAQAIANVIGRVADFRSWCYGRLGDSPANRAASDLDLRRRLDQKVQAHDKIIADAREALGAPTDETLLDRIDYLQLALVDAERDRDAFAAKLADLERARPRPDLVDGQPMAFVPTQQEADTLGLDLAASYTATLIARRYSVTGVFQIEDAVGRRVGGVQRTYPATKAEATMPAPVRRWLAGQGVAEEISDFGEGHPDEAAAVERALTSTGSIAGAAIHLGISAHEMKVRIVRNRVEWPRAVTRG